MTFLVVLLVQWTFVGKIGTDVPFYDQWNVEGRVLYPALVQHALVPAQLFSPSNEHRIVWTQLLDAALFKMDGQWDPLLQLAAICLLRAGCAALVTGLLARLPLPVPPLILSLAVAVCFLPFLAWHSVLWGFESQVYFALGFSLCAIGCLAGPKLGLARSAVGLAAGLAGLFAMQPAAIAPVALVVLELIRALEARKPAGAFLRAAGPSLALVLVAFLLWPHGGSEASLHPPSVGAFLYQCGHVLSWPFAAPWPCLVIVAPLGVAIALRISGRRQAVAGEDAMVALGLWAAGIGVATAWARGGSPELSTGVPSRYVDFLILLPIACAAQLALLLATAPKARRPMALAATMAWAAALLIGWLGLSVQTWRGLIGPRLRDPEAPVRYFRRYQAALDPEVFNHAPRLYAPAPDLSVVRATLQDPVIQGRLPPSLQPERPEGPLSRWVRAMGL